MLEDARFRAWLIDLDGTLYWAGPVRVAMAIEMVLLGPKAARVIWRFRREHEDLRREPFSADGDIYLLQMSRTAAACGASLSDVHAIVDEWMIVRPAKWVRLFRRRHLIKQIRRFRQRGGLVAIVSDYPARYKLQKLQLIDLPHVIIANGEDCPPRRLKPSPDGYQKASERLGVEPSACLVIGDRLDADGVAATRANMAFQKV